MGWTSYHATYYKNGQVDRKAECDAYFMEGPNAGHFLVKESAMVGTTYYAAVQTLKTCVKNSTNDKYEYRDLPEWERTTWACVMPTSVRMKDYYNFAHRPMDETEGPYEAKCPKSILKKLSPTENEFALAWRERCLQYHQEKQRKGILGRLKEGSRIRFVYPYDHGTYFTKGEIVELEKRCVGRRRNADKIYRWLAGRVYMRLVDIPAEFTVVEAV